MIIIMNLMIMNHDDHCDYDVPWADNHDTPKDHNMFWACDHDASQAHDYDDNYEPVDPYILDYDDYDDNWPLWWSIWIMLIIVVPTILVHLLHKNMIIQKIIICLEHMIMLKIVIIMIIMYFLHARYHQWFNFISKGMYSVCTISMV